MTETQTPPSYTAVNSDPEANNWTGFTDKAIRRLFVRKVYSILSLQLFISFAVTAIISLTPVIKNWVQEHAWIYWVSYGIFLTVYITLACCDGPRRQHPTNLILLLIFTLALSFMVAMICTYHSLDSVLIAAGITAVCCAIVSVLSCWTKFDFTKFSWALLIAVVALIIMAIIAAIFAIVLKSKALLVVYGGLGTVLFMLFLAYDTQLIMGGRKYAISPEEYIMATICLYVDIVQIFLCILQMVSGGKGN